ncbi:hypothetical protein PFISCL1PPCAC_11398, partial [Pristionchus fissidentatus]
MYYSFLILQHSSKGRTDDIAATTPIDIALRVLLSYDQTHSLPPIDSLSPSMFARFSTSVSMGHIVNIDSSSFSEFPLKILTLTKMDSDSR